MGFENRLSYKRLNPFKIELIKPFYYRTEDGILIKVPKGFRSDGLSVPKMFHWFQSPFGFGLEAGIIHDFILETKEIEMSFLEADEVFEECLDALGVGWFRRHILKLATDINGIFVHGNKKPNNLEENQKL